MDINIISSILHSFAIMVLTYFLWRAGRKILTLEAEVQMLKMRERWPETEVPVLEKDFVERRRKFPVARVVK